MQQEISNNKNNGSAKKSKTCYCYDIIIIRSTQNIQEGVKCKVTPNLF